MATQPMVHPQHKKFQDRRDHLRAIAAVSRIHGVTVNGSVNRDQVRDGAALV